MYNMLLIYNVKRTTKLDGMDPFNTNPQPRCHDKMRLQQVMSHDMILDVFTE